MRIGIVVDAFLYGGLETHLIDFAAHVQPSHDLHFIVGMRADISRLGRLVGESRVLQLDMSPEQPAGAALKGVAAIADYCSEAELDLLHVHPFFSAPMGALAAIRAGLPFVVTLHGPGSIHQTQADGGMHLVLLREVVLSQSAYAFCVSTEVAAQVRSLQPSARIQVLPNSVDTESLRPIFARQNGDWALVGRLDRDKLPGMIHFLEIMKLARPHARIRVFGRGDSQAILKDLAERRGWLGSVSFEGFRDDLPEQLKQGVAGVAGMGRVVLEAAALDLPLVLVGYDGTKGLVSAREVGRLSDNNYSGRGLSTIGAEELARQLGSLDAHLSNYSLRGWISEHADSRKVWARYTELIASAQVAEHQPVDWLAVLREQPLAHLASAAWESAVREKWPDTAKRDDADGAGKLPEMLQSTTLSSASGEKRSDTYRNLAVKCVKPILPEAAWRAAKAATVAGSRKIAMLRYRRDLEAVLAKHENAKGWLIYPPTIDWGLPLFQRPQQLALSFAEKGFVVFFCTPNAGYDHVRGFVEVAPRTYVTDQYESLRRIPMPILLISLASHIQYVSSYNPSFLIYDYIDDLTIFDNYGPCMVQQHHELIKRADLVTATAQRLFDEVIAQRSEGVVLSPNACDYSHFARAADKGAVDDAAQLLDPTRPVIGYYGALAEWFDYDLVIYSTLKAGYQYLLIGLDYDGTMAHHCLEMYPDVHFIGPRDYQRLPDYASLFDVATIPFQVNKITEATSPLKLYEYMAAGKPVVTTDLRECHRYESVLIGKSREEFVNQLRRALELRTDPTYLAVLRREAQENTWSARVDQMLQCLGLQ